MSLLTSGRGWRRRRSSLSGSRQAPTNATTSSRRANAALLAGMLASRTSSHRPIGLRPSMARPERMVDTRPSLRECAVSTTAGHSVAPRITGSAARERPTGARHQSSTRDARMRERRCPNTESQRPSSGSDTTQEGADLRPRRDARSTPSMPKCSIGSARWPRLGCRSTAGASTGASRHFPLGDNWLRRQFR